MSLPTISPEGPLLRNVCRSLDALPAPFARLLFLGSLRDPYTGRYLHEGWASLASAAEVHELTRQLHILCFLEVIDLPLEALCAQMRDQINARGGPRQETAKAWLEGESFREMIPLGRSSQEREFFLSQMRAALHVLSQRELPLSLIPQSSSPPQ